MKRYIKRIILIVVVLCLIGGGYLGYRVYQSNSQQYTGEQWFSKQKKYVKQMEKYADGMDDVFALYISNAIGKDDFLNHLDVLSGELTIMETAYNKEKAAHPIKTGTHSYHSKKGCESVEDCYKTFEKILDMASQKENYSDIKILSYKYLAYQQELIKELANYMASTQIIDEEKERK